MIIFVIGLCVPIFGFCFPFGTVSVLLIALLIVPCKLVFVFCFPVDTVPAVIVAGQVVATSSFPIVDYILLLLSFQSYYICIFHLQFCFVLIGVCLTLYLVSSSLLEH